MTTTYTARWVLPVAGPPLAGGTVTVDGPLIAGVEPPGVRTADVDLGNVAVIPGLVNAHTHLDLSGARGRTPPTDPEHFTDWLKSVIAYRRSRSPEHVQADVRAGLAECLTAGTTLLGDITAGGASWDAVSTAAVRAVLGWELIGLSQERYQAAQDEYVEATGDTFLDDPPLQPRCPYRPSIRWWLSPHAPYSAYQEYMAGQLAIGWAVSHLAESSAELELLSDKRGAFVQFLTDLGLWNPDLITRRLPDFFHAMRNHSRRMYVHCNYLPQETSIPSSGSIVYCPRTHAAFGHPPHPFRDFLARGVRVCLGTDGLTSNPDLDILSEARFVAAKYPDFPGDQLLRMVTLSGAEALGWSDECGSLEVGKSADFVAVPLPDRDGEPYRLLFSEDCGPRRTWFRGEQRSG